MGKLLRSSFALAFVLLLPASGLPCSTDAECMDSNQCALHEHCDSGACVSDPVNCDDGNPCTQDTCDLAAGCQYEDQPDGSSCSDGNVCNGEETCHGGNCGSGPAPNCDDGDPCTADSCTSPGGCRHIPTNDPTCGCVMDTDCVASSACTTNERCVGGSCVSDTVNCDDGNPCTSDSCDAIFGCRNLPVVDGIACGDGGDVCNPETCQGGTCLPGAPPTCDDGNPCTIDGCDPVAGCTVQTMAGCFFCNTDMECRDRDSSACTVNERCVSHACVSDPLTCNDGNPCTTDSCDAATGCTFTPVPNGQSCGDLDPCNGLETCQSGTCTPGTAPLCDDGNPCTVDACDSNSGCTHTAVQGCSAMCPCCVSDSDCTDSDPCTVNERCVAGSCTSDPRNCGDNNPCTQDSCVSAVGCVNTPVVDGTGCGDGNRCNGRERCISGACQPGTPPNCDDNNACTADSCAPTTGCQHSSIGGAATATPSVWTPISVR